MRLTAACGTCALALAMALGPAASPTAAQGSAGEQPAAKPQAKTASGDAAPSPEQLARWAAELDADEFLTRDTAMLRLLEAGPAALPPVAARLQSGSVEAITRALYIVRQFGLSADVKVQQRAGEILTEAAEQKEIPALARRAAATLEQLREERSIKALAELEALGAKYQESEFIAVLGTIDPVPALEIGDTFRGTASDLWRLGWLSNLTIVKFSGERVTDDWVAHVAAMPDVAEIHLYQVKISDQGLDPLVKCNKLEQVGLYYSPVGDRVLEPLRQLPALRFVKLYGTRVTPEVVAGFAEQKGASVDHRRGAFLGVGASAVDEACVISRVHQGSPAEKAKLLMNDVIVGFGGEKVSSFNSLTALISRRDAGEEVEIEVLRQTVDEAGNPVYRKVTTKATLAPWEFDLAVRNVQR